MSIFTVPQKKITVEIYYLDMDGNLIFFQDKESVKDDLKGKIKTATAEFAYESWDDFNKSMKLSVIKDPNTGDTSLDPMILRDVRLRKLLKKVTDGDGNEITVNDKEISGWSPEFCMSLMSAYLKHSNDMLSEVLKSE